MLSESFHGSLGAEFIHGVCCALKSMTWEGILLLTAEKCTSFIGHLLLMFVVFFLFFSFVSVFSCTIYLAHLSDGVIKHSAGIISSFSNQLHFPRAGRQTKVSRVQFDHLLSYLREDRLTFLTTAHQHIRYY